MRYYKADSPQDANSLDADSDLLNKKVYILKEATKDDDTFMYADVVAVYVSPYEIPD